jgi:hypothetical protein
VVVAAGERVGVDWSCGASAPPEAEAVRLAADAVSAAATGEMGLGVPDVGAPAGAGDESGVVSPQAQLNPMRKHIATMALTGSRCIGFSVDRLSRIANPVLVSYSLQSEDRRRRVSGHQSGERETQDQSFV